MIILIASICIGAACKDVTVTTSQHDATMTDLRCTMGAPAILADWLGQNYPGYRLTGWKCVKGYPGSVT